MIDIKQYINTKTAIHCETEEESFKINKLIVKYGGRNLHHLYRVHSDKTGYSLENVACESNCYSEIYYYKEDNYTIIKAKDILNKENIMTHTFKSGLVVQGTQEEIAKIGKFLGEPIFPTYKSATKGDIPVDEMNEIHLRNAILLHLREYFTQKNFKNMDNESFLDNLEVQNFPETIEMLIKELNRRINS